MQREVRGLPPTLTESVVGVAYPAHFGKGLEGDVFDRPEPVQVVVRKPKRRSRGQRWGVGGRLGKMTRR